MTCVSRHPGSSQYFGFYPRLTEELYADHVPQHCLDISWKYGVLVLGATFGQNQQFPPLLYDTLSGNCNADACPW